MKEKENLCLRDWFAGMALQGLLSNPEIIVWTDLEKDDPSTYKHNVEYYAFQAADEMIIERKKVGCKELEE